MRRLVIGLFSVAVLFILFVVLCTYVRRPYEKIIVERFGSLIDEQGQTRMIGNWYFKYPTDSLVRIDTRLHLQTLSLVQFTTAKSEPVNVQAYVVWHIVDPRAFKLGAQGSDEYAEKLIGQSVQGLIGQTMGSHNLGEFFNTDPKTEQNVRTLETSIARDATGGVAATATMPATPGLDKIGIEIADVGFSRLTFPPNNTEAVYGRMVADLNQKSVQYQAEGMATASVLEQNGITEAKTIVGEATSKAGAIRGDADRQALEIISGVAKTDAQREFYQYWKSLDFLKASFAKNTILVLSTDSPLWKRLFGATQMPATALPPPPAGNEPVPATSPERK